LIWLFIIYYIKSKKDIILFILLYTKIQGEKLTKKNKITRVSLTGGLIGALTTNPKKALENEIDKANQDGWSAIHFESHKTTNLFIMFLQIIVLILTVGLFTWGGGYLILFEKESL